MAQVVASSLGALWQEQGVRVDPEVLAADLRR